MKRESSYVIDRDPAYKSTWTLVLYPTPHWTFNVKRLPLVDEPLTRMIEADGKIRLHFAYSVSGLASDPYFLGVNFFNSSLDLHSIYHRRGPSFTYPHKCLANIHTFHSSPVSGEME